MNKTYIGKVEAFEVALERKIDKLPRKGIEILTVPSIAENRQNNRLDGFCFVLGKDERGFFLAEQGEKICTYDISFSTQKEGGWKRRLNSMVTSFLRGHIKQ